jgi:hypothetical protein
MLKLSTSIIQDTTIESTVIWYINKDYSFLSKKKYVKHRILLCITYINYFCKLLRI